ncbi:hypothetical protein GY12_11690 [Micrococcus luteus]|nr:hypothetical protein GY12_11690 [Micrococcus luteus]
MPRAAKSVRTASQGSGVRRVAPTREANTSTLSCCSVRSVTSTVQRPGRAARTAASAARDEGTGTTSTGSPWAVISSICRAVAGSPKMPTTVGDSGDTV